MEAKEVGQSIAQRLFATACHLASQSFEKYTTHCDTGKPVKSRLLDGVLRGVARQRLWALALARTHTQTHPVDAQTSICVVHLRRFHVKFCNPL